ncbi:MAG: glycosyltransferase [Burkholderiales bacterium]|nr:glycosyltransferase [Burkholderiales bacterium]
MRILHVSDVYFPRVNGVSTSIRTFRAELERLGHESALVAPRYPVGDTDEPGVHRIDSRYLPLDPEDRAMRWRPLRALARELAPRRFDLVHVQTPFLAHYAGLAFARAWDVPAVATYHTLFEEYLFHYVPFAPRAAMRALARRFSRGQCNALDAVVAPSGPMRDALRRYGVTAPIEVIPTGLRPEELTGGDGARFRSRYGIPPSRPLLAFVGRVAFEKNIDFLLRMLLQVRREIPDVLLVVTGEGPAESRLKRLATALELDANVRFLGYLDRGSALLDCYRAADAFVFASRTETQGLVLLEAMALGTPVVALAVMGTADILREGRGALIAPDDEREFAARVVAVLADPELAAALSASAREHAAAWSAAAMARRLAGLYERVLASRAGRVRARDPAAVATTAD